MPKLPPEPTVRAGQRKVKAHGEVTEIAEQTVTSLCATQDPFVDKIESLWHSELTLTYQPHSFDSFSIVPLPTLLISVVTVQVRHDFLSIAGTSALRGPNSWEDGRHDQ